MNHMRRLLASLLCVLMALSPVGAVLSESEVFFDDEIVIAEMIAPEPEDVVEQEPTVEPTAEPAAESTVEPTAEPTVEPTAETTAEPTAEPAAESTVEPTAEPTVEPTAEPAVEPTDEPIVLMEGAVFAMRAANPVMSVDVDSVVLGVGESLELNVAFSDGESYAVRYSSEDPEVAAVTDAGTIVAQKRGSTRICLTDEFENEIRVQVAVEKAPTAIRIAMSRNILGIGESFDLPVQLSEGSVSHQMVYASSNPAIVEIDAAGRITAVGGGWATVAARTYNGKLATFKLGVAAAPESISFANEAPALGVGQKFQLTASLNAGSAGEYSFESLNPEIASVDAATGEVTARAVGTAKIRVSAYNGVEAFTTVAVKSAPGSVRFAQEELVIGVGELLKLPGVQLGEAGEDCAAGLSYASSDEKIAIVSQDGHIYGSRAGYATVTVTAQNGKTGTLNVAVFPAPKSIRIAMDRNILGVGESFDLPIQLSAGSVSCQMVYASSNPAIVEIDAAGRVTAVGPGWATVAARTYNGKLATFKLGVAAAPESLKLDRSSLTLGVNEEVALNPIIPAGSYGKFEYTSSDEGVAIVDAASGKVKGVSQGTATITVRTYNGHEASCKITVKAEPTGISMREESLVLALGDLYQLQDPEILGENAGCSEITYITSNSRRVAITQDGLIGGAGIGTAAVGVQIYNGSIDAIWVTVKAAPTAIAFEQSEATMFMWDGLQPKIISTNDAIFSYTLKSSNPKVAAIGEDGRSILPVKGGTAQITATSYNGKVAKMNLTVLDMPESVSLKPASLTMGEGDSQTFRAVMPEGQGSPLLFSSSNPAVAEVDDEGNVTAIAPGSATITVETYNDLSSSAEVTVKAAPTRLQLTPREAVRSIDEGSLQLKAGFGSDAEGGRVSFSSSDETVATVSSGGKVTFVSTGTVQICATTYNGRGALCDLTIGETPAEVSFAQDEYRVAIGDSIRIPVEFDKGCESYSFAVADSAIAGASGDTVQGKKIGSTTLTVTSRSGLSASCKLTVAPAPEGIELKESAVEIKLGLTPTYQLTASVLPDGVGSVIYTTSDPDIAEVDYVTGLITGRGAGECVITAATYDGKHSAQCAVTVKLLLDGVKVGIDPGHQAVQNLNKERVSPNSNARKTCVSSGATGRVTRIREHVTNLVVGLKLRDALEALGAEVYMTRETADVNITNVERALMMNELGVDLVLRLHCDSADTSSARGMSIYTRKTCGFPAGSLDAQALLANEKYLAGCIFQEFQRATNCRTRKVYYTDEFSGNNWSIVPCLLVEMGFSSNPTEDVLMNTPEYQDLMVKGMINGICRYKGIEMPY